MSPSVRKTQSPGGFRPEIEGLRAIAVLSVVLFHLKVAGVRGGFSGVDIFFVISGYLITRIILSEIASGHFSFRAFYARRIRRIFPAMLFTVAVTLVAGALWFPPAAFRGLAEQALSSLTFVANIYFWWDAHKYFSANSDFLPLLHLWSLSVEEQFYIVWPLLILLVARKRDTALTLLIAALVVGSLCVTLVADRISSGGAFYLTPFRVYQFGLGALVVRLERERPLEIGARKIMQGAGFVLCALGIFVFGPGSQAPSVASSLGAACLIYAGRPGFLTPILTNRAAATVGRLSYSLYLAHWPVVVFATYVLGEAASTLAARLLQVAVMAGAAALMFRYIERPFIRRGGRAPVPRLIGTTAALAAVSMAIIAGSGWEWRLSAKQASIDRMEVFGFAPCGRDQTSCRFGAPAGKTAAILIGDSYAQHYVAGIDRIANELGLGAEVHIQGGCLVLAGVTRLGYRDNRCLTGRDRVLEAARRSDAPLIIGQAWMGYFDLGDESGRPVDSSSEEKRMEVLRQALERTIDELGRPGRRILIIGPQVLTTCAIEQARLGAGPLSHAKGQSCAPRPVEDVRKATRPVNDMLRKVQANHPGVVTLLIPEDYMCNATCPVEHDGATLYQDPGHLTVAGSLYFGDRAREPIADFLLGRNSSQQ